MLHERYSHGPPRDRIYSTPNEGTSVRCKCTVAVGIQLYRLIARWRRRDERSRHESGSECAEIHHLPCTCGLAISVQRALEQADRGIKGRLLGSRRQADHLQGALDLAARRAKRGAARIFEGLAAGL